MEASLNDYDLEKLSEQDKGALRQFLNTESQKARVQSTIHSMTDMCWKKCMHVSFKQGQLDTKEKDCLTNCVDRFFDASKLTMKHLQDLRQG